MKAQKGGKFIALPTRYFSVGRGGWSATRSDRCTPYNIVQETRCSSLWLYIGRLSDVWQDIWIVQDDFLEFVCLFITQDMAM
jgi:hypothetical protein